MAYIEKKCTDLCHACFRIRKFYSKYLLRYFLFCFMFLLHLLSCAFYVCTSKRPVEEGGKNDLNN